MKLSLSSHHSLSQQNYSIWSLTLLTMFFSTHKSLARLLNASGYSIMIVTGTFILITAFHISLLCFLIHWAHLSYEYRNLMQFSLKEPKMQSLQQTLIYDGLVKEPDFRSAKFKSTLSSYTRTIFRKCFFNFVLPRSQSSTELGLRMGQKCAFEN